MLKKENPDAGQGNRGKKGTQNHFQDTTGGGCCQVDIRFTKITSHNPATLTKSFHLGPDGELIKTPGGPLTDGIAETLTTDIEGLKILIPGMGPATAVTWGTMRHTRARVVTEKRLSSTPAGEIPVIARTRTFIDFPAGPAVMPFDFDGFEADHADAVHNFLIGLNPALKTAPMLIFPSASSGIHHGETCLRGLIGWRALVIVADGTDIKRAGDTLFKSCWLQGNGKIVISESGAQLIRATLDGCVYSGERLDFVSGAYCKPPLEQRRPEPVLYNENAPPLDTRTIKSLTAPEQIEYERLVTEAKAATKEEAAEKRNQWIERRIAEELAKHPNATDEEREAITATYKGAAKHRILHADFVLYDLDGEPFTVADALANPDAFDGRYIRDPLEPFGENSRARLHLKTTGRPYIWSFYQQCRFTLTRTREKIQITPGARVDTIERLLKITKLTGCIYYRGGEIVAVSDSGEVKPLDPPCLQFVLDGLVMFQKFDARTEALKPADCPKPYAEGLAAAARLYGGLPELKGIVTHPTIDIKTGRIIERDGFDVGTGLMLRLNGETWPHVPDRPDPDTVVRAVACLLDPFLYFPFAGPVDRGVYLSTLLTAVIRPLLDTAPAVMITAPTPGTGKTLLARCVSRMIGILYPTSFPGGARDEQEITKRLLSIFRTGAPVILWDNLTGTLQSESLCAALTLPTLTDRILGVSNIVTVPTNSMFVLTGNNIRPAGDLCRRTITARLDAGLEKPWKRTFDENILERIDRERPKMITAALTLLKATIEGEHTAADGLGSFEEWNATARAAVCYAAELGFDVADPALSIEASLEDDPETGKLRALLNAWFDAFGDTPTTAAAAITKAMERREFDREPAHPALFDACEEVAGERGFVNVRRLSRWIERERDRIIDGFVFELTDVRTAGAKHWKVKVNF